jgi:hypothetical protein
MRPALPLRYPKANFRYKGIKNRAKFETGCRNCFAQQKTARRGSAERLKTK